MSSLDEEFLPLPYYPYESRPSYIKIDEDEAATALYLKGGVVSDAAELLRVAPLRLQRVINRSARLQHLHGELVALLNDKVHAEVIRAFSDEDSRRREWASMKVIGSRQFQVHPLAPSKEAALNVSGPTRIVISWDDGSPTESTPVIEHRDE